MNTPVRFVLAQDTDCDAASVVRMALQRFSRQHAELLALAPIEDVAGVVTAVEQAQCRGALLIHALGRRDLRTTLAHEARQSGVRELDLLEPLGMQLVSGAGQRPPPTLDGESAPGDMRMEQIVAIEYSLAHDDGALPEDWHACDILLMGVSRVGKTPLSMYLAVLGWKVANTPVIPGIAMPRQLAGVGRERVIGLTISLEELCRHRAWRQHRFGAGLSSVYAASEAVQEELAHAQDLFHHAGYAVVDVTGRSLGALAADVLTRRFRPGLLMS